MSVATVSIERWTPRKWLLTVAVVLIAQTAVIAFLSQRVLPPPRVDSDSTEVMLINGAVANDSLQTTLVSDPTLFALMDRRGFSGKAWLDFSLYHHSLSDWQEPPRWLAPDAVRFGASFQRYAATSGLDRLTIDDQPLPRANVPAVAGVEVNTRSTLVVGRELAGREIVTPVNLPSRPHTDLLPNTVVQIVVNGAGDVLSARLLTGCGVKDTDQIALEQARALRFAPLPPGERVRGNPWATLTTASLTFQWHTVPAKAKSAAKGVPR